MLKRIEELLAHDISFSIETTLATRSYVNLVSRAQTKGYRVCLLFFWLNTPDLAIKRVAERVSRGGHNIRTDIIKRRYLLGIKNLFNLYMSIVDYWVIYDNSGLERVKVATGRKGEEATVFDIKDYLNIHAYVR